MLIFFFFFFDQICPKREFLVENGKITRVRASMVVSHYIKLFRTGANRHNGILMSLLLLVAEAMKLLDGNLMRFTYLKHETIIQTIRSYYSSLSEVIYSQTP